MQAPGSTHRLAIIGRTGSGKTQAAAWHLSRRSFEVMPWIIFDYKRDSLLNRIGAREVKLSARVPARPGLYITHPLPGDAEAVEKYLWKIWDTENTGVYIDEGYMMGQRNAAFRALLTQGRSKKIPMIVLSQRPVWMDNFVWSESDYFQVFHLNDYNDRQRIQGFVPFNMEDKLPKYWSRFYSVADHESYLLQPVPSAKEIAAGFKLRTRTGLKIL